MSNVSRFIGNERGDKICHEDDGCPTEVAVLKRFWREHQASNLLEEVTNLVEFLDDEDVPYEDSSGIALSLVGRAKQYASSKTTTLREQVEKLKAELTSIDGALNDPRANLTLTTSEIIWELKEQVKKLTKERDAAVAHDREACRVRNEAIRENNETRISLTEQLAALAEQNEKMRKVLLRLACLGNGDQYGNSIGNCIAQEALSLHDLASTVLNRIRAEALHKAAKWFNDNVDNRTDTWQAQELRRMAAELEKTNEPKDTQVPQSN